MRRKGMLIEFRVGSDGQDLGVPNTKENRRAMWDVIQWVNWQFGRQPSTHLIEDACFDRVTKVLLGSKLYFAERVRL